MLASQVGSEVISGPCAEVDPSRIKSSWLESILEQMRSVNSEMGGVGISANQIGESLRVSLVHIRPTEARPDRKDEGEFIFINPQIIATSGVSVQWEGCLSVAEAGIFALVERPEKITLKWTDVDGETRTEEFDDMFARVILHEIAHLDGKVFLQEPGCDRDSLHSRSEYVRKKQSGEI